MNSHHQAPEMTDNSISGFETTAAEPLSREFTEVTLVRETEAHQFYRAKRFGRWYMLKALPPARRHDEFHLQMLRKEMEILMQLQHPGIVGCLGLEQLPDYYDSEGRLVSVGPCIVLEYIDGQTLAEWLNTSPRGGWERVSLITEFLDALAYLHAAGIIHRDLKPSNIMLTRNGQHVKIIDFSLADTDSHAILKQPSGTRQYMAPEQETMTTPDVRNDIYSVGVIIDEILHSYSDATLGGSRIWSAVARRCQLPIEQRYANIAALQTDIARRRRRRTRLRWAAALCLPFLLITLIIWSVATASQQADRLPRITAQAIEQLEDSIAATGLTQHIDTLSQWRFLDPQVNEKILSVNAFIYDYAETQLTGCTDRERNDILCQMLDRWQSWHDHIVRRAKYLMPSEE